ncbi:MAG: VTT domain-containing protein [Chloroflexi bacterium]|nr:VTT domain-containing protein [Chloroflexota bacterium]
MINSGTASDREKWTRIIPVILFVLAATIFALVFDIDALKKFLQENEKLGLIICLAAYILLSVTIIPSEPITFLVLAWKGPLPAILLAALGNTVAALVEFVIGGNIGDLADFEAKKEKLPFHLGRLPFNSPVFLLLARMLPGFGPKFVSIAGGVYKVPFITYLWTTAVANLIGAAVVVLGGTGLIKLFN